MVGLSSLGLFSTLQLSRSFWFDLSASKPKGAIMEPGRRRSQSELSGRIPKLVRFIADKFAPTKPKSGDKLLSKNFKAVKLMPAVLIAHSGQALCVLPLSKPDDRLVFNSRIFRYYKTPSLKFRVFVEAGIASEKTHPKFIYRIAQVAYLKEQKRRAARIVELTK